MKRRIPALVPALTVALILLAQLTTASAATGVAVEGLSSQWAQINFERPANQREALLKSLHKEAQQEVANNKGDADLLTWAGIVTSSYAGAKGGLGALGLAKQARRYFEQAMAIDPEALNGGARTSLGVLYYQVPSWPIGFGKDKTAEQLLVASYEKHPDNIDALYFYADFLTEQKRTGEAIKIFKQALELPATTVAQMSRHRQIERQLAAMG